MSGHVLTLDQPALLRNLPEETKHPSFPDPHLGPQQPPIAVVRGRVGSVANIDRVERRLGRSHAVEDQQVAAGLDHYGGFEHGPPGHKPGGNLQSPGLPGK